MVHIKVFTNWNVNSTCLFCAKFVIRLKNTVTENSGRSAWGPCVLLWTNLSVCVSAKELHLIKDPPPSSHLALTWICSSSFVFTFLIGWGFHNVYLERRSKSIIRVTPQNRKMIGWPERGLLSLRRRRTEVRSLPFLDFKTRGSKGKLLSFASQAIKMFTAKFYLCGVLLSRKLNF